MKKLLFSLVAFLIGGFVMSQYNVTFNVDMTDATGFDPITHEVYLSGDFAGWAQPGSEPAYKFTDAGNSIYTLTLPIDSGRIQYKYFYCEIGTPSWDFGEWSGTDNRHRIITADQVMDNVWGDRPIVFTFNVEMTYANPFEPSTDDVYLAGTLLSDWNMPGTVSDYKLAPSKADPLIYTLQLPLAPGEHLYKYFRVISGAASWDNGEWAGDPNRAVIVDSTTMTVDDLWGSPAGIISHMSNVSYSMYPNPVYNSLTVDNLANADKIEISNVCGEIVKTLSINSTCITINLSDLNAGMYFVIVHNNGKTESTKFLKN
jgi:hypothetical protein